jgi:Peptidase C39 family
MEFAPLEPLPKKVDPHGTEARLQREWKRQRAEKRQAEAEAEAEARSRSGIDYSKVPPSFRNNFTLLEALTGQTGKRWRQTGADGSATEPSNALQSKGNEGVQSGQPKPIAADSQSQPQLVAQVPTQPAGQWQNEYVVYPGSQPNSIKLIYSQSSYGKGQEDVKNKLWPAYAKDSPTASKGALSNTGALGFDGQILRVNKEGKTVTIPFKKNIPIQLQPGDKVQSFVPDTTGKSKLAQQQQNTPVDTFKQKLSNNALKRLQDNSNRLKSELKDYQNLSPNNPKWQQLRQLAIKDQQLVQQTRRLDGQIAELVIKDRKENSFTSPNTFIDRDDVHPLGVVSPRIQAQIKQIESQRALLKIARRQMQAQYPALAVVDSAKVASSSNQALLGNINQGFGQIQGNITDLQKQIQADPSKALFLDDVVKGTLSGLKVDPNNPNQTKTGQEITNWLQGEQTKRNLIKWGGTLLTGGLTVGAIITTFASEGLALPFWLGLGGAVTGLGTAAYDYRELATVDLAANAQQGGTKLTSQDKETARFNLMMGRVNLLMSGLDVGLSMKAVTGLMKGARSAEQMSTLARAMKAQEAGQAEEALATLKTLRKELGEEAYQEIERVFGGRLEPGNPNSTSLPRNGKREVLNQMDAPENGKVACGPTSCGMVLNTAGKPVDIGNLLKQTQISSTEGTRINKLAEVLRANGIKDARWLRKVSIDDLAKATNQGNPAIVHLRLGRGDHYVLVDGITLRQGQKVVAIRDPAGGRQYFTPLQEFTQSFKGDAVLTNSIRK